jgi:thiol-disulfide isomerase/thioredoxin
MLKFTRLATAISVVLLGLTTACSQSEPPSASNSEGLSAASEQTNASAVASKVALASHLKEIDAKFYGAYWCAYCNKQKEMFGQQAFSKINYIECDPKGKSPQLNLCEQANIDGFPTWEIKGQQYKGMQPLEELADISGYQGDRNFGD